MAESLPNVDDDVMELSEGVKFIYENAKDVSINEEIIMEEAIMVMQFLRGSKKNLVEYSNKFQRPTSLYPCENENSKNADWLFVLHTLNFALWYPKQTKQWIVNNKIGYLALCETVKRAVENNWPLWDPNFYAKITRSEFEQIFRSDDGKTSIPLIDERLKILHETGEILLKKYKGTFMECIKTSDYDANKLIKLLYDEFESYRDEVIYNEKKVRFLIKARALMCDLWRYFKDKLKFQFNTNEMIPTIFLDHRIPHYLLEAKILRYSDELKNKLNTNEPLVYGSKDEIELRGCLLFVVKEICKRVSTMIHCMVAKNRNQTKESLKIPVIVENFFLEHAFPVVNLTTLKNLPTLKNLFNCIGNVYY